MTEQPATATTVSPKGCLRGLGTLIAGLFVAIVYIGGLVLAAWGLHRILNGADDATHAGAAVIAGVLIPWIIARSVRSRSAFPVRVTLADAMAGVGSLVMAGMYLMTWARPSVMGPDSVEIMVAMLVLEFLLVHSAPFLAMTLEAPGPLKKRLLTTLGMTAAYVVMALGLTASIHSWVPFLVFSSVVFNKFLEFFFHRVDVEDKASRQGRWGVTAMCFLGCAFLSVFLPVPRLGAYSIDGEGLWQANPEQALMAAAVYFSLLGFYELYFQRRK